MVKNTSHETVNNHLSSTMTSLLSDSYLLVKRPNKALPRLENLYITIFRDHNDIMKFCNVNTLSYFVFIKVEQCQACLELLYVILINYKFFKEPNEKKQICLGILRQWMNLFKFLDSDTVFDAIVARFIDYLNYSLWRRKEQSEYIEKISEWIWPRIKYSNEFSTYSS
ncbi:MAG: hypothetical protein MHPSP_004324, partial [Paramarteilia canceri]